MKILHIFGPEEVPEEGEGLWAAKYDEETEDALTQFFKFSQDPELMAKFCSENIDDIRCKFGYDIDPETAASELMDEADELMHLIVRLAKRQPCSGSLQQAFKPLNNELNITVLQTSKASSKTKARREPRLRIYAVRIDEHTYVVTGGAIKLTNSMQDRPHTEEQLRRVNMVRDWLKREGISYPDDLNVLE